MVIDNRKRGPDEAARIDIDDEYEVRYWTARFGVRRARLEAAFEQAGPLAKNIEAYLHGRRPRLGAFAEAPQGTFVAQQS